MKKIVFFVKDYFILIEVIIFLTSILTVFIFGEMTLFKKIILIIINFIVCNFFIKIKALNCQNKFTNIPTQLLCIFTILSAFVFSALVSPITYIPMHFKTMFMVFIAIIGLINSILLILIVKNKIKKVFCFNRYLFVALFISIIPRILMLNTFQRWDAGEYYYSLGTACSNFSFQIDDFINSFSLANHTTIGFSFIMSIGEFLNYRGQVGVLTINLILTIGAIYRIYKMIESNYDKNKYAPLIGSLLFSVTPFFLGSFGYISPDYAMVIFFIFIMYNHQEKNYLLELFWLIIMINTKEPAIFILFGYYGANLLYDLLYLRENKYLNILKNTSYWNAVFAAGLFLVLLVLRGGITWKGGNPDSNTIQFSNSELNSFGINWSYILLRIKHCFILNYAWVYSLAMLWCIVKIRLNKGFISRLTYSRKKFLFGLSASILVAFIFNTLYITAGAYRYVSFVVFMLPLLVFLLICYTSDYFANKKFINIILLFAGILFVNTFVQTDPLSFLVFPNRTTGTWRTLLTNFTHEHYGNDLCNNYQYTWVDRSIDKMLSDQKYNENMDIIYIGGQQQGLQLAGNGNVYRVAWNEKKQKREMYDGTTDNKEGLLIINMISFDNINHESIKNLNESAIVFFVPYYNIDMETSLNEIKEWYNVIDTKEYSSVGGVIYCYELEKK